MKVKSVHARQALKTSMLKAGLFIAAGLVLSIASALNAFVNIAQTSQVDAVLAIAPNNPNALAKRADQELDGDVDPGNLVVLRDLATKSLREQAINPRALRILAYHADLSGDRARSARNMNLALKASRREFGTHLLAIENAVTANNVSLALRHYDLALRTSTVGREFLLERLVAASSDPVILRELAPYVRADPPWLPYFLSYSGRDRANGKSLARLWHAAGGFPEGTHYRLYETAILEYLVTGADYSEARRFFLAWPDARPSLLTSPSLTPASTTSRAAALGWQLTNNASFGAAFAKTMEQVVSPQLELFSNPGVFGLVAGKHLFLQPSTYLLDVSFRDVTMPQGSAVNATVSCFSKTGERTPFKTVRLQPMPNGSARFAFTVPRDCEVQLLSFEVQGGRSQEGMSVLIDRIALTPAPASDLQPRQTKVSS